MGGLSIPAAQRGLAGHGRVGLYGLPHTVCVCVSEAHSKDGGHEDGISAAGPEEIILKSSTGLPL